MIHLHSRQRNLRLSAGVAFQSLSAEVVVHDAFGFNATELRRAEHEVHDIANGRYDGRI